ncbi:MAG: hypothetical protein ACRDGL_07310, partial [Candidatus Limnocylindrales bacterium]
ALVSFPWGSLLRGIVGGEAALVEGLAALLRVRGKLTVLLSLTEHDVGLGGVPATLDRPALEPAVAAASAAGLELVACCEASRAEVLATGSSWAKRIRAGSAARPAWLLAFRLASPEP